MLELEVGDREGVTGKVMRREHDCEHPRYVIAWDDGEQSEIWPNEDPDLVERLQLELEEGTVAEVEKHGVRRTRG